MIDKPADPEVVAANAAAMDALTNGDGPEPSIPAGAAQTAAKGPQPMGGGFTLDDLTDEILSWLKKKNMLKSFHISAS